MPFKARVFRVLIASPSDMVKQRDEAQETILSWNETYGEKSKAMLLPLRWERDATPDMSDDDAQQTINRQLVSRADIVVAFFHTRLGTPTGRDVAGTAEEIRHAMQRNVPVHVWMSSSDAPADADPAQLGALTEFMAELSPRLIGTFDGDAHLSRQITVALSRDVVALEAQRRLSKPGLPGHSPSLDQASATASPASTENTLDPSEQEDDEVLWSVEDLRRLAADERPAAKYATRLMDVLATQVDEYFPTSQLTVDLDVSWEEHRSRLGAFGRIVTSEFSHLAGVWPFSYDWRRSTAASGSDARQNHYYLSLGQAARWAAARAGS